MEAHLFDLHPYCTRGQDLEAHLFDLLYPYCTRGQTMETHLLDRAYPPLPVPEEKIRRLILVLVLNQYLLASSIVLPTSKCSKLQCFPSYLLPALHHRIIAHFRGKSLMAISRVSFLMS